LSQKETKRIILGEESIDQALKAWIPII